MGRRSVESVGETTGSARAAAHRCFVGKPLSLHTANDCGPRDGDWRHRAIKIVILVATVSVLLLSGRGRSELALGAIVLGYMMGTLPSHV